MTVSVTVEHGYRDPGSGNRVFPVREDDANTAYMSAEEYARLRASATGGAYVCRARVVSVSEWGEE